MPIKGPTITLFHKDTGNRAKINESAEEYQKWQAKGYVSEATYNQIVAEKKAAAAMAKAADEAAVPSTKKSK